MITFSGKASWLAIVHSRRSDFSSVLVVTILLILFDYVFFDAPHREHRRQRQQQYHEDHEVKHASRHGVASLNEANAFWFLHARDDCAVGY